MCGDAVNKYKRIKFKKKYSKRELKNIIDTISLQLNLQPKGEAVEQVTYETVTNIKTHDFKFVRTHICENNKQNYKPSSIIAFKYKCKMCNIIMVITDKREVSFILNLSLGVQGFIPCYPCKTVVMMQAIE